MVNYIKKTYPLTQLVVVGFSLGGNIVCKYLGESQGNQERVLCCVSVCQGYSALRWVWRLLCAGLWGCRRGQSFSRVRVEGQGELV